jgi:cytochrome c oxidase assembly protein subunit 11
LARFRLTPAARTGLIAGVGAVVMIGAAYAAVPLYRAFCQATGFNGTVMRAATAPKVQLDRKLTVTFDTNVLGVPFTFEPVERNQEIKIGATGLAHFKVTNTSDHAVTARAMYSVVPESAGAYVRKIQCFCFSDQTLQAHQTVEFPTVYFIDPGFATDRETSEFHNVTLSYTFFEVPKSKAQAKDAATPARAEAGDRVRGLGGKARARL